MKKYCLLIHLVFVVAINSFAQNVILHNFNGSDGQQPYGKLSLSGEMLYGMAYRGGTYDSGCVFRIDTDGNNFKILYSFNGPTGNTPRGSLTIVGYKMYGMTTYGGVHEAGTIFSIDTSGNGYKKLFDFDSASSQQPLGSLVFSQGKLYGTTWVSFVPNEYGCVFSIDTTGNNFKKLLSFHGFDGIGPTGDLVLAGNSLYGMTEDGSYDGVIFSCDTNGKRGGMIYEFVDSTGGQPNGALAISGHTLFGMTYGGGDSNKGCLFSVDTNGYSYKVLMNFMGTNGASPFSNTPLVHGNTIFATTTYGGNNNEGVLFSIDTSGNNYTPIESFSGAKGINPLGGLLLYGNNLYGMTSLGGMYDSGVVYKINYKTVGINELPQQKYLMRLYPNPNKGVFYMELYGYTGNITIGIYNELGDKIYSTGCKIISGSRFPLKIDYNPSGTYMYRILSAQGGQLASGKFIIQQ